MLKGYKAGADDYLNKPLIQVLLMKIKGSFRENHLRKAEQIQFEFTIGKFHLIQKIIF
jgi:DNA-binding response OmpR family regulator